jgi:hypothetical protein
VGSLFWALLAIRRCRHGDRVAFSGSIVGRCRLLAIYRSHFFIVVWTEIGVIGVIPNTGIIPSSWQDRKDEVLESAHVTCHPAEFSRPQLIQTWPRCLSPDNTWLSNCWILFGEWYNWLHLSYKAWRWLESRTVSFGWRYFFVSGHERPIRL